jgi:hypothetical protein
MYSYCYTYCNFNQVIPYLNSLESLKSHTFNTMDRYEFILQHLKHQKSEAITGIINMTVAQAKMIVLEQTEKALAMDRPMEQPIIEVPCVFEQSADQKWNIVSQGSAETKSIDRGLRLARMATNSAKRYLEKAGAAENQDATMTGLELRLCVERYYSRHSLAVGGLEEHAV